MPFRPGDSLLPLTPIAFEILLALIQGDLHGYAVLQEVEQRVGSVLPLRTGTLYRALARLMEDQLIEQVDGDTSDPRRRYYRLTALGRETASAEARRLEDQVRAARRRKLLTEPKR
ncbi:MAG: helix-turn-helix transcriptional regulator [Acidobacteria bacterium]|nr:helix-turn-helix transcriptional regulator [Acidobacteriota bacterium]